MEPYVDEQARRRLGFNEGVRIRLADGQFWSFPDQPPQQGDDEHIDLLRAIGEAEDVPERLHAELAFAIFLLSLNYDLTPSEYQAILVYAPGDPRLAEMQHAIHELAMDQRRALRSSSASDSCSPPHPTASWRLANLLRLRPHNGVSRSV